MLHPIVIQKDGTIIDGYHRWTIANEQNMKKVPVNVVKCITGPHAVGAGEDAEVDAATARRAALDLDVGVGAPDFVDQSVDGEGLGPTARSAGAVGGGDEVAVHVPLQVGDVVVVEQ